MSPAIRESPESHPIGGLVLEPIACLWVWLPSWTSICRSSRLQALLCIDRVKEKWTRNATDRYSGNALGAARCNGARAADCTYRQCTAGGRDGRGRAGDCERACYQRAIVADAWVR